MGQHTDALGSLDSFKAPWESDLGQDAEVDTAKLKKYLYNLLLDKAKAQDAREEAEGKVKGLETQLEEAKAEVAKGDPEGKIAKLEKQVDEAKAESQKAQHALDKLEVGIEKGLTPKQAARLQGDDRAALEKDAAEILETFGVKKTTTEETDEEREEREEREAEEAEQSGIRQTPRLVNGLDPKLGKPDAEPDYEKIADGVIRRRF